MRRIALAFAVAALLGVIASSAALGKQPPPGKGKRHRPPAVSVYASGFNNPRGLTFGPGRNLYVAEGGLGGSHSSASDPCPRAHGAAAPYFGSSNDPVLGGRISKVGPDGTVSTIVAALPSSQTSPALGSLVSGVSSVAFVGRTLYGLLAGAGCSHGVPDVPNGVFRLNSLGLALVHGSLYALQLSSTPGGPTPGTGAIVRVGEHGQLHTVVSGLVFPTVMTAGPDGALYVSEQGFGFPAGQGRVVRVALH